MRIAHGRLCARPYRELELETSISDLNRPEDLKMYRRGVLLISVSIWLCWLCPESRGYFTNVDAHAEECFFDRVSSGMKMSLSFEVVEGGFLDIDVKVCVR